MLSVYAVSTFFMCGELLLTFYFIIIYQMNCGVHLRLTQSPR